MGAYVGMVNLVGDICNFAKTMNYPESSICVLKGDIEELKNKFPDIYSNLISCEHNRDKREPIEYGRDLVASWLFEDYIIWNLSKQNLDITKNGTDKKREILQSSNVSHSSDCLVCNNDNKRSVEIMCDYSGWWKKTHNVDLRDRKYMELSKENSILLGISFIDKSYFIMSDLKEVNTIYIPEHKPYGNKPAYRIIISDDDIKKLNFKEMAFELSKSV
jgi:hypothetical protein